MTKQRDDFANCFQRLLSPESLIWLIWGGTWTLVFFRVSQGIVLCSLGLTSTVLLPGKKHALLILSWLILKSLSFSCRSNVLKVGFRNASVITTWREREGQTCQDRFGDFNQMEDVGERWQGEVREIQMGHPGAVDLIWRADITQPPSC